MWERNGGRGRAGPWPGRRVIQMKLEAYEKCVFLLPKCTSTALATSYNGPSEWDRASVRGRETAKPHERRLREHLSFCNSQSSKSSLESMTFFFWPIVRFYLRHFVSKRDYAVSQIQFVFFFSERKWCSALHKLFSKICFSDLTRKVRSCLHMLMHECRNPDPVVNAQCIHSRKTQKKLRVRPKRAIYDYEIIYHIQTLNRGTLTEI